MNMLRLALVATLLISSYSQADEPRPNITETMYLRAHVEGEIYADLRDGTVADETTNTHAIEYAFAPDWYAAVGKALHYAHVTGKRAGIVLIIKTGKDADRAFSLMALDLPITVWTVVDLTTPRRLVHK